MKINKRQPKISLLIINGFWLRHSVCFVSLCIPTTCFWLQAFCWCVINIVRKRSWFAVIFVACKSFNPDDNNFTYSKQISINYIGNDWRQKVSTFEKCLMRLAFTSEIFRQISVAKTLRICFTSMAKLFYHTCKTNLLCLCYGCLAEDFRCKCESH